MRPQHKGNSMPQPLLENAQIDFVFQTIIHLLQNVDVELKEAFIRIKQSIEKHDSTTLLATLTQLNTQDKTLSIIKAFTLYHMLLNIIEELNASANMESNKLAKTLQELAKEGYEKPETLAILEQLCFYPVFTAHPTESRRRTFLEAHHQMSENIKAIFMHNDEKAKNQLLYRLTLLWHTHLVRSEKMEILYELDNLLYIIESSVLESATEVLNAVETLLDKPLESSPITLGSWIGGDRDGNPYVNNEIMTKVMKITHNAIINIYINKCEKLIRELSLSMDFMKPTRTLMQSLHNETHELPQSEATLYAKEPFRAKRYLIRKKLKNRLIAINAPESVRFTYANSHELLTDIDMLIESLDSISAQGLREFRHLVLLGGFHLFGLDFREHRDTILNSISEIFCLLGLSDSDFKDLSESKKCAILNIALSKKYELHTLIDQLSQPTQQLVGAFLRIQWAKKHISERILQSFIISMSSEASDLLCVLWFAKQSGLWKGGKKSEGKRGKARISITPLFETIDDLQRAQHIIKVLHTNPHYQQYMYDNDNTQEIMVGYSDSSKDGGIFASNYNLHCAISNITHLQDELGIKINFFHGRGGSVSRGGGSLEEALLSSAPKSVYKQLKTTEQGEMISAKYLHKHIAKKNLSSTLCALLKKEVADTFCLNGACESDAPIMALLKPVSLASYAAYRALVYENKGFMSYFKMATPIAFIQNLHLGSRPSKRKDTQRVEDLRAIPWVFAWTQNRSIIPAWYGLGSGLAKGDKNALKDCYQQSLFFKTTIDNISQAMLKVDLDIARLYSAFVADKAVRDGIWECIYTEYQLTLENLLHLRGESELLDSQRAVRESILLRKPYLSVLNLTQIELIKKYQSCGYAKAKERILEQIHATIVGIAQGIRNTG
ncbi:phosphoenolpyruvate carboxylase [uncultured Helicobacter sp.]|uniref:phosphoenolpyruvate carboxylase n=2 Tax=uncultured Helicobacter sp. TaxID=175537 RepID=UPI002621137C|nr:phosphoenolpyruvate carboxylase [uncultured Helicobacter sp.]